MVLSTTKRTASISSIVNRPQGGGEKKAGFPYQVGRTSWSNVFIGGVKPATGRCCKLSGFQQTLVFTKNTVRPLGVDSRIPMR